jgi:hypothetical protein
MDDFKKKMASIADLEKKLKKKFKELSENNDFMQHLNLKADSEDTKKEFYHVNEKLKNFMEVVNQFRREFEEIQSFYD